MTAATRVTRPRVHRPQPEVINGHRIWTCDACGARGEWGDEEASGWRWFGYYRIVGHGASAGEEEVIERVLCPDCPNDREGPVPS